MSNLEPVCAVAAGVLSGSCAIPYVRDMVRGTTRPHRVSWGIFALLAAIAAASQLMHGFTTGAVLSLGAAVAFFIVFVMSMRHGVGGATLADRLTLAGTVGILVVWAWSGDTTVAVTLVIVLEVAATGLTMRKAWRDPASETQSSWVIDGVAGALALVGASRVSYAALAYPAYHFMSNNAMVAVLVVGRRRRWSQLLATPDPTPALWRAPLRAPLRPPLPPPALVIARRGEPAVHVDQELGAGVAEEAHVSVVADAVLGHDVADTVHVQARRRRHGAFGPHRYVPGSTGFVCGHVQHHGGGGTG